METLDSSPFDRSTITRNGFDLVSRSFNEHGCRSVCMAFTGVILMPLPDASAKSPRIYTLLQNQTLEGLTFDNLKSVGQPIAIEMMNEDELRRLILINLARLTVKSEWNGLL